MITYSDLYEYARKERYSNQLQKLPKNFVSDVAKYIKDKRESSSKNSDVFSDSSVKSKKQLENAMTLFRELILRRRKKILDLILIATETGISKQDFENMLDFEKELFEEFMKFIEVSEKSVNSVFNGEEKSNSQKNELIVFSNSVEELAGFNGESIGPFEKGDIANIPSEIAKILVEDGKAELVDK